MIFLKKKILVAIGIILVAYILFVTAECIRLENTGFETKPIITVSSSENEKTSKYTGLGYSVIYYKDNNKNADGNIVENIYGAEFRLFDKIMIWAWIE